MNDMIKADAKYGLPQTVSMAPGLALLFNDALFERCKDVARIMAAARGFTPPHLIGQSEACFGIVQMSITWRLSPQFVAASTYQTPGGKIGYEGKLVQSILENSGHLVGPIKYEMLGDWSVLRGNFRKEKSSKPSSDREYFVPGWDTNKDEEGLGVRVSAQVKGETEPRSEEYWLRSFWPRNSTLWALRPEQQIKYAAARAFASTAMPGILMGMPFDFESDQMVDITPPAPQRRDFEDKPAATVAWDKATGEVVDDKIDEPEPAEFGFPEARQLGILHRDSNRPMSAPADLAPEWHEAFLDGWRARDDEITAEKKGKKS